MTIKTRSELLADIALYLADNSSGAISEEDVRQRFVDVVDSTLVPQAGMLYGLTLSNNNVDPTNDINIAAGRAADSSNAELMILSATITKRLDAAWAAGSGNGGLDTGTIADGTYHVFLIMRSDTGASDVLFSTSASSPTMPTNYDYKRRIGSIVRASGAIRPFIQLGDNFYWTSPTSDVAVASSPGTAAQTATLTVPTGIVVLANVVITYRNNSGTGRFYALLTALSQSDTAPSATANQASFDVVSGGTGGGSGSALIPTSSSGQLRWRVSGSGAGATVNVSTFGWVDGRDRT